MNPRTHVRKSFHILLRVRLTAPKACIIIAGLCPQSGGSSFIFGHRKDDSSEPQTERTYHEYGTRKAE